MVYLDKGPANAPNETAFRTAVALVHVLLHVLDGENAAADFDVDVAVVLQQQGGIVGTTHWLVRRMVSPGPPVGCGGSATVVGAGVDRVGVVIDLRLCLIRLGKLLVHALVSLCMHGELGL